MTKSVEDSSRQPQKRDKLVRTSLWAGSTKSMKNCNDKSICPQMNNANLKIIVPKLKKKKKKKK